MEVGLGNTPDPEIFAWARREGPIIVSRNDHDFAPLVEAASRQGTAFPGILFCATSLRPGDVGGHMKALETWSSAAQAAGVNPVENFYGWLR